jgi:hypothetical protein
MAANYLSRFTPVDTQRSNARVVEDINTNNGGQGGTRGRGGLGGSRGRGSSGGRGGSANQGGNGRGGRGRNSSTCHIPPEEYARLTQDERLAL